MTDISPEIRTIIKKCQSDPRFFINRFCKVKHPTAGIIPFKLFSYQKKCLEEFKKHRFNIFRKTRQCFAGNTPIWTTNGPILIKDLRAGDFVLTYDIQNDKIKSAKINDVFNNGFAECYELETVNGHKLVLTGDHKLLTKHNGWVKLEDLNVDDYLVEFIDNSKIKMIDGSLTKVNEFVKIKGFISSIRKLDKQIEVFDLNVPPYHNYIADGIVAHNCGISTLSGAYSLWVAMFHNAKTILIVSKRDEDAMNFLNKNIKFVYDHLPKWMKEIWPVEQNQHKILFSSNSSSIQSLTSSPDTLRSNSSTLNIIDEAAFIDCMDVMWTGGWSCVSGNTIINVNGVLRNIDTIGDKNGNEWQDINIKVQSDTSIKDSDKFFINGYTDTYKITTLCGYEIECTSNHRLKDKNYNWIYTKDIKIGDKLALKVGNDFSDKKFDDGLELIKHKQIEYLSNGIITKIVDDKLEVVKLEVDSRGIFYDEVIRIEKSKNYTYDLSVPNGNTYVANGFVSHNTLMHGGSAICISTTNGLGNWYANTWQDALENKNDFNPIDINWWDMDWEIKYELNGKTHTVSPIAGIRKLTDPDEISKYGPYWSPWLESQYRGLVEKGNDSKFRQEVLCVSGNTEICTIDGFRQIKDIKVGDKVLTHFGRFKNVVKIGSRQKLIGENVYKFYSKNGYLNEFISGNHPISSIDSWKTLDEFNINIGEINAISICKFQGELSAELNVVKFEKNNDYNDLLYNIEVEDDHTYCTRHCIVHNCEFLGTGNTVLSREQLGFVSQTVSHEYKTVKIVEYVNPVTGERCNLDFVDSLYIWKEPIQRERWCTKCNVKPEKINIINKEPYCTICNGLIVLRAHSYVLGADISSGESNDFSTIQVIDIVDKEQVAELKIKALPKEFSRMIDYVGRKYNDALAVVERDGIGRPIIQELHETLCYPNLYRDQKVAARTLKKVQSYIGYSTGPSNKPVLNRALLDMIGGEDDYIIRSNRLLKEFHIYMYLNGSNRTGAQPGEGNNDDLVISFALALIGSQRIDGSSNNSITPYYKYNVNEDEDDNKNKIKISDFMIKGGRNVLLPSAIAQDTKTMSIEEQLYNFTSKLGGLPMDRNGFPVGMPASVNKQKNLKRK